MKSLVVAWLERNGLPGWLAPDYMMMVGIAALLGAAMTMWLSERDAAGFGAKGAEGDPKPRMFKPDTRVERRALIATYLGALVGGYAFEWLRVLPEAMMTQSLQPFFHVGRAAYGGFLGGTLCAVLILRRGGAKVRPFLDRTVPLCGISYGFVRVGCFLAGCDYGKPTASAWGVRFPAGSPAAMEHASLGWVARGGESLPVHATQLYEAAVGIFAALAGSIWLVKGKRDGRAFATFIVVYAVGRFFVEMLRGDGSRGVYGTVSTAQWVSIGLVAVVGALVWHAKRETRRTVVAAATLAMFLGLPQEAAAQSVGGGPSAQPPSTIPSSSPSAAPPAGGSSTQTIPPPPPVPGAQPYPPQPGAQPYPPQPGAQPYPPQPGAQPYPYPYPYPPQAGAQPYPYPYPYPPPPGAQPYPYPYPYPPPGAAPPPQPPQKEEEPEKPKEDHQKALNKRRLGIGVAFGLFLTPRFGVANGGTIDFDVAWRVQTSERARFEFGLGGAFVVTGDATLGGVSVPLRFVGGVSRVMEFEAAILPFYQRISFDSPYFEPVHVFGVRLQPGMGWTLGSHFQLGISPFVLGIMGSPDVQTLFTFEPKFWLRVAAL